jgi:hypothetical protein
MKTSKTELRISLFESFTNLLSAVNTFCLSLRRNESLPMWVSRTPLEVNTDISMRFKAIQLFQALWYEDGQDGRDTLTCPGVIGADGETLALAKTCNAVKDTFKKAVLALKTLPKADMDKLMEDLHQRDETVATAMQRMGAARLNLKQAYRHIPVLDKRPVKIGFTWSKQGRTIQRTSVQEARRLLERRRETPQTRLELERLVSIAETEMLARVRRVCPHLRVNLVFQNSDNEIQRRLMQAPLPILVPLQPGEPLPEFVPIAPEPTTSQRLQRSDVRIEEEVFLPSIRVYRYQARYRY